MKNYKYVIIVDDNETTIFLHSDLINDCFPNSELITFTNSQDFINDCLTNNEWFENETLLLLDINMPNKLGYDVLEEIEEEIDDIDLLSVLMVTSSNLKRDVERSERFVAIKGYVEKPLDEQKLRAHLD